jgi:hypothetical protein
LNLQANKETEWKQCNLFHEIILDTESYNNNYAYFIIKSQLLF